MFDFKVGKIQIVDSRVIEALNMASMSVMMAASYFPEYVRARISAGIMFTMIRQKAKIDNRGLTGETPVNISSGN